jgi:hypothetical protein
MDYGGNIGWGIIGKHPGDGPDRSADPGEIYLFITILGASL